MSKVLTVVQARRGSSRLPDKVTLDLMGATLLERMVERVMAAKLSGTVVLAIPESSENDALEGICKNRKWPCFRGSENDLLDRHYQAAKAFDADIVLKIPSDVPLIDPKVIDLVVQYYLDHAQAFDFVSNLHPPTWPDGMDVEVMPMPILETAWKEAQKAHEREHTTPFIWDNPHRFRIGNVAWDSGLDYSMSHRFTIDYPEDYSFIRTVYEALYPTKPMFGLDDILQLLDKNPDIYQINAAFAGVNWYRNHLEDLQTVRKDQTKNL